MEQQADDRTIPRTHLYNSNSTFRPTFPGEHDGILVHPPMQFSITPDLSELVQKVHELAKKQMTLLADGFDIKKKLDDILKGQGTLKRSVEEIHKTLNAAMGGFAIFLIAIVAIVILR